MQELKNDLTVQKFLHPSFQDNSSKIGKETARAKISLLENESDMLTLKRYISKIKALLDRAREVMKNPSSLELKGGKFPPLVRHAGLLKASDLRERFKIIQCVFSELSSRKEYLVDYFLLFFRP
ncbi:hypothetical protein AMTR_s00037p00145280 [Amborella trichopoda]|uniref:Uncharacterized protein n=1 Tax=Amborella trichopoda TaxID=13333 RepID=U5CVJ7_AMBTC|nr:hypothetical protein AMTR_s00037p00145280 [Amborella trichopoda]